MPPLSVLKILKVSFDYMTSFSLLGEYSSPNVKSEDGHPNECILAIK